MISKKYTAECMSSTWFNTSHNFGSLRIVVDFMGLCRGGGSTHDLIVHHCGYITRPGTKAHSNLSCVCTKPTPLYTQHLTAKQRAVKNNEQNSMVDLLLSRV